MWPLRTQRKRCLLPTNHTNVETSASHEDLSAQERRAEMDKGETQSTVASDSW